VTIEAADLASPDGVVNALYRFLSGSADTPRDWAALATLCVPDARLMPVTVVDGSTVVETFDVAAYARSRTPLLAAHDFYEREIGHRVEQRGHVAQVWSEYEARRAPDGPPFMRGVGSFQLLRRDDRWWIVSAVWQAEHETHEA
jgi:hypothetical protein